MTRSPAVFFVSSEFHFSDRFPQWKSTEAATPTNEKQRDKARFAAELDRIGFDAIFITDFLGLNRTLIRIRGRGRSNRSPWPGISPRTPNASVW